MLRSVSCIVITSFNNTYVISEVFTAVRIMMMVIMMTWVLAPCRLVGRCQSFEQKSVAYCLEP
jgi:uncharacterized membrane protein